jgi:hypothetical protein
MDGQSVAQRTHPSNILSRHQVGSGTWSFRSGTIPGAALRTQNSLISSLNSVVLIQKETLPMARAFAIVRSLTRKSSGAATALYFNRGAFVGLALTSDGLSSNDQCYAAIID